MIFLIIYTLVIQITNQQDTAPYYNCLWIHLCLIRLPSQLKKDISSNFFLPDWKT